MRPTLPLLLLLAACATSGGAGPDYETANADAGAPDDEDTTPPPPPERDAAPTPPSADAAVDAAPPADLGPGGDFRAYADSVAAALHGFYDQTTGLFPSTGWWNSANAITALVDYMRASGSKAYVSAIANTFSKNSGKNFLNDYYDDEGWWALAWIDAYDLTQDDRYLGMAKTIFADMAMGWDPSTCNGGIWWSKAKTYKNAIANELFLEVAIRLHARTPGDTSFLDWANKEWAWFDASGMINGDHLVNDGLDASCKNNDGQTWTYNQGVLVGGLVDLSKVTSDPKLLTRAQDIARAAMAKLVDDQGVLHEPCEPSCGGDGTQFKGIFMRHLAEVTDALAWDEGKVFIATNAAWIGDAARDAQDHVGTSWSQALDAADASRQSSALDALNAAIPLTAPQKNLALKAAVTANGSCAGDQVADRGVDGDRTTKWCAGATNGAYFIDVDLGAPAQIGRVVVRHAEAGGERAGWNTRDFSLVTDGASAAKVTGNTRAVTIHRLAAAPARHLRLEITASQTDPTAPAARVYEVEAYAR